MAVRRKGEPDVSVRVSARVAQRLKDFVASNDKGIESMNEGATFGLAWFLDEMDRQARRKEAWDAWIRRGRKGIPPPMD